MGETTPLPGPKHGRRGAGSYCLCIRSPGTYFCINSPWFLVFSFPHNGAFTHLLTTGLSTIPQFNTCRRPPNMSRDDTQTLQRICTEFRINFVGFLDASQWPDCHRQKFTDIRTIGSMSFDTYVDNIGDLSHQPWRPGLIHSARDLVERAKVCLERTEDDWKFEYMKRLDRFFYEVVWCVS